ncbi:C4-dicarboxylate-binding protein DctP [Oscillibacter sp. PC13]|uniref:TRAP transporter substrate-binding protein n=1 Tax=Oscillibacter sp. PC13 TaxID=1855299 RepID=UPI0008F0B309|nr:TRAP transporter substrate-binding protein [Oscillibacter sp. PC13]SFP45073.1 C4-dicarboxylate-binding protein DctP [Oscillibacter sp. PC13]
MKRWKMLACALMACALTLSLVACGGGDTAKTPADSSGDAAQSGDAAATGEKIVWKLAHTCADTTAVNDAALLLSERLSEATDGNFVIEVYPNSQLGGNREALEGMQFGTIEMSIPNVGMLGGYSTSVSALELPYLIEDVSNFDVADKVLNTDIMTPIKDELAEAGFLWMGSWYQGSRHLTTTKTPVHTPADMKGLKIRTMESELHMAHFNALGANAVPMAFSEVFTALQQGAIDGQENPYLNIYTQGMHEVQGYVIETAHIFDVIPLLVSKTAYESLSAEYQQALTEVCEGMVMDEWEMVDAQNKECKQKIIDAGKTEIIELTVEERMAFREAAQPVYDEYAPKIGSDFVQSLIDAQQ